MINSKTQTPIKQQEEPNKRPRKQELFENFITLFSEYQISLPELQNLFDQFFGWMFDPHSTIKTLRLKLGYSQYELGKKLDSCQSIISRIESGKQDNQISTIAKLYSFLYNELLKRK